LFLSLVALSFVGGVLYVLPASHLPLLEERLRYPLTAMVSGLIGYVLFGAGLIPLEQVPLIARVVHSWLPYQVLPAAASLFFAAAGLLLMRIGKSVR
jgi:hypothetical protein